MGPPIFLYSSLAISATAQEWSDFILFAIKNNPPGTTTLKELSEALFKVNANSFKTRLGSSAQDHESNLSKYGLFLQRMVTYSESFLEVIAWGGIRKAGQIDQSDPNALANQATEWAQLKETAKLADEWKQVVGAIGNSALTLASSSKKTGDPTLDNLISAYDKSRTPQNAIAIGKYLDEHSSLAGSNSTLQIILKNMQQLKTVDNQLVAILSNTDKSYKDAVGTLIAGACLSKSVSPSYYEKVADYIIDQSKIPDINLMAEVLSIGVDAVDKFLHDPSMRYSLNQRADVSIIPENFTVPRFAISSWGRLPSLGIDDMTALRHIVEFWIENPKVIATQYFKGSFSSGIDGYLNSENFPEKEDMKLKGGASGVDYDKLLDGFDKSVFKHDYDSSGILSMLFNNAEFKEALWNYELDMSGVEPGKKNELFARLTAFNNGISVTEQDMRYPFRFLLGGDNPKNKSNLKIGYLFPNKDEPQLSPLQEALLRGMLNINLAATTEEMVKKITISFATQVYNLDENGPFKFAGGLDSLKAWKKYIFDPYDKLDPVAFEKIKDYLMKFCPYTYATNEVYLDALGELGFYGSFKKYLGTKDPLLLTYNFKQSNLAIPDIITKVFEPPFFEVPALVGTTPATDNNYILTVNKYFYIGLEEYENAYLAQNPSSTTDMKMLLARKYPQSELKDFDLGKFNKDFPSFNGDGSVSDASSIYTGYFYKFENGKYDKVELKNITPAHPWQALVCDNGYKFFATKKTGETGHDELSAWKKEQERIKNRNEDKNPYDPLVMTLQRFRQLGANVSFPHRIKLTMDVDNSTVMRGGKIIPLASALKNGFADNDEVKLKYKIDVQYSYFDNTTNKVKEEEWVPLLPGKHKSKPNVWTSHGWGQIFHDVHAGDVSVWDQNDRTDFITFKINRNNFEPTNRLRGASAYPRAPLISQKKTDEGTATTITWDVDAKVSWTDIYPEIANAILENKIGKNLAAGHGPWNMPNFVTKEMLDKEGKNFASAGIRIEVPRSDPKDFSISFTTQSSVSFDVKEADKKYYNMGEESTIYSNAKVVSLDDGAKVVDWDRSTDLFATKVAIDNRPDNQWPIWWTVDGKFVPKKGYLPIINMPSYLIHYSNSQDGRSFVIYGKNGEHQKLDIRERNPYYDEKNPKSQKYITYEDGKIPKFCAFSSRQYELVNPQDGKAIGTVKAYYHPEGSDNQLTYYGIKEEPDKAPEISFSRPSLIDSNPNLITPLRTSKNFGVAKSIADANKTDNQAGGDSKQAEDGESELITFVPQNENLHTIISIDQESPEWKQFAANTSGNRTGYRCTITTQKGTFDATLEEIKEQGQPANIKKYDIYYAPLGKPRLHLGTVIEDESIMPENNPQRYKLQLADPLVPGQNGIDLKKFIIEHASNDASFERQSGGGILGYIPMRRGWFA